MRYRAQACIRFHQEDAAANDRSLGARAVLTVKPGALFNPQLEALVPSDLKRLVDEGALAELPD